MNTQKLEKSEKKDALQRYSEREEARRNAPLRKKIGRFFMDAAKLLVSRPSLVPNDPLYDEAVECAGHRLKTGKVNLKAKSPFSDESIEKLTGKRV